MKIKALKSFCGTVTMGMGEEKEVSAAMAAGLIGAGYATACVEDRQFDKAVLEEAEANGEKETDTAAEQAGETKKTVKRVKKNDSE